MDILKSTFVMLLGMASAIPNAVAADPADDVNLVLVRPPGDRNVPDYMVGVPLDDVLSGERAIGAVADAAAIESWRETAVRNLWTAMYPELDALTREQYRELKAGAVEVFPEEFTFEAAPIMGGEPTFTLSPVGMILLGTDGRFYPHCTGILTAPDVLLSARHCVARLHAGDQLKLFMPFGGIRDLVIENVDLYCEEGDTDCSTHVDDVAYVKLAMPFDIVPAATRGETPSTAPDSTAKIYGFGLSDKSLSDNGILRSGDVILDDCNACTLDELADSDPSAGGRLICFDFAWAAAVGVDNLHGNLDGDSGGPMMVAATLPNNTVGISSRVDWRCSKEDDQEGRYVNITHDNYSDWLEDAFCEPPCTPLTGELWDTVTLEPLGSVDPATGTRSYTLMVRPFTKRMVLTLNHEINGYNPFPDDLELVLPEGLDADCERHDGAEACTVDQPPQGDYQLIVKTHDGLPNYQLAVVAIRCPDQACWDDFTTGRNARRPLPPGDFGANF